MESRKILNFKDADKSVKDKLKKLPESLENAREIAANSPFINSVINKAVLNLL